MPKIINDFRFQCRYLSNFHVCPVHFNGHEFISSEHAYLANKCKKADEFEWIKSASTPKDAKRRSKVITPKENWHDISIGVMSEVVYDKFKRNLDIQEKLLATGDATLIEGNTWGDTFWGVCNGSGKNHLGLILMDVRNRLS